MIILCLNLLPNDKTHGNPDDIRKIVKPTPVIDEVLEVDVVPLITIVSIDSNIVFRVLEFFYLSFDL